MDRRSYRRIAAVVMFLVCGSFVHAQVRESWVARLDGGDRDEDLAAAVAVDADGNVLVAGYSVSPDTGRDYLTVKYDRSGALLWQRRYDGMEHGDDLLLGLAVDGQGSVYVYGRSWAGTERDNDFVTIKYDSDGNELWVASYNGPASGDDGPSSQRDMALDSNDNVCVLGDSMGTSGKYEFTTLKYDTDGALLWEQRYASIGPTNAFSWAIAVDDSDNVYVSGVANNENGSRDYALLKYDADGNVLWERLYDGPAGGLDLVYDTQVGPAGNVYMTGISDSDVGPFDYATVKYAPNGDFQWAARYDNGGHDYGVAVVADTDQNVYVTGASLSGGGQYDIATLKYDSNGNQLWLNRWSQSGFFAPDWGWMISIDSSDSIYVAGTSWNGLDHGTDALTLKYEPGGVLAWEQLYNGPGNGEDFLQALAIDDNNSVYVAGVSMGEGTGPDFVAIKYAQAVCDGTEFIKKANCKTKQGQVKKVVVIVKNGWAGQDYVAMLDTGEQVTATAKDSGKVKFTFKGDNVPGCGFNGVTVCDLHADLDCGC